MKFERRHAWTAAAVVAAAALVTVVLLPDAMPVETAAVDRGPLRVTIDEDGETRVRERYVVAAPVTGRMVRLECEVGDQVAAGELVARIYPLPLDTRARQEAAERLEAAEAAWAATRANVAGAETAWREAQRGLQRLERVEASVPGAIARQRLDEAAALERTTGHAFEQASRTADAAAHEVATARAALLGAEGGGAERPTLVHAPAAGRILRLYEECERAVAVGSPILEIGDPTDLEVVVDVLTEDAARLRPGAPARIVTGGGGDTLAGTIHRIDPSAFTKVSPLGVEEQRVDVVVRFDGAPVLLGDRFRVDASLVAWQADDVLRVPVSALFRANGDWAVFVAGGGRARLRRIELGQRGLTDAEVVNGLREGERVVVFPSEAIEDGTRIE